MRARGQGRRPRVVVTMWRKEKGYRREGGEVRELGIFTNKWMKTREGEIKKKEER